MVKLSLRNKKYIELTATLVDYQLYTRFIYKRLHTIKMEMQAIMNLHWRKNIVDENAHQPSYTKFYTIRSYILLNNQKQS